MQKRYTTWNEYLRTNFGEKIFKVPIDAGFDCPNRDGTVAHGGCTFCTVSGSGDMILEPEAPIADQFAAEVAQFHKKWPGVKKYIVYFQNFTNTYDSISNLKLKYDSALIDNRIVALAVATRPDCINEDICKLLKSYCNKYYVWVELGLQTSNDETGKLINRGYSSQQFSKAVDLLNKYNIDVVTHIMVGLPNESLDDIKNTIDFINNHNIQGLKIHCTYVVENTVLASMYYNGTYTPISLEYYLECAGYILSHINPNIVIHRVSGDAPKDLLVAPDWNSHKKWIMNGLDKYLRENDLWQGKYYI